MPCLTSRQVTGWRRVRIWGIQLLEITFWLQALMLAAGGGIACINSIHREKEQNTFDYQRVTRMTPLELALGKLFGAPVFTYFVFLCLMPLALFGAVMGKRPALTVAAAYAVLLVASLAVHTLALLISLLTVRGSHTAAILVLVALLAGSASGGTSYQSFAVHAFGPRSEEHTSELQSHHDLVCRLLLEKKKKTNTKT